MRRAMQTVGWGLYLASSWTWCIGMFLPTLLLRWWGWPGFLAFAVPNVLGCALFGYVLSPETSRGFCLRNAGALRAFAWATVAYQAWFVQWATTGTPVASALAPVCALLPLAFLFFPGGRGFWPMAGSLAFAASMACFVWNGAGALTAPLGPTTQPPSTLLWAAPFMAFGFALCPYLDPTFHRALQQSPSRHAFAVFGVAFALALLFAASTYDGRVDGVAVPVPVPVWLQWTLQTTFTSAAMLAVTGPLARNAWPLAPTEFPAPSRGASPMGRLIRRLGSPPLAVVVGPLLLLALTYAAVRVPALLPAATLLPAGGATPWSAGESTYLRWLGLYGVLFPALVLFRVRHVPRWRQWLSILVAAVLAERGMVGGNMPLLAASLGVILLTGLMGPSQSGGTREIARTNPR